MHSGPFAKCWLKRELWTTLSANGSIRRNIRFDLSAGVVSNFSMRNINQQLRAATASIGVVLLIIAIPSVAQAVLYKWVDEQGNVQFSDRPPVTVPPGGYEGPKPPTVGQAFEQRAAEQERQRLEDERLAAEAAEAAELAEAAKAALNEPQGIDSPYTCAEAKNFYKLFATSKKEMYRADEDGKLRPSTPEEMQARAQEWKEAARVLCDFEASQQAAKTPPSSAGSPGATGAVAGEPEAEQTLVEDTGVGGDSAEAAKPVTVEKTLEQLELEIEQGLQKPASEEEEVPVENLDIKVS